MHTFTDKKAIHDAEFTSENQAMSADVITKAFLATEEEFLTLVKKQWLSKPLLASVGTCCLVGIICSGQLYIANAGDSRAVLGRLEKAVKHVKAIQLSIEHNASYESVREELHSLHPDDPHIVVLKHKVWRVKGVIQVIFLCFRNLYCCKLFIFVLSFLKSLEILWPNSLICIYIISIILKSLEILWPNPLILFFISSPHSLILNFLELFEPKFLPFQYCDVLSQTTEGSPIYATIHLIIWLLVVIQSPLSVTSFFC